VEGAEAHQARTDNAVARNARANARVHLVADNLVRTVAPQVANPNPPPNWPPSFDPDFMAARAWMTRRLSTSFFRAFIPSERVTSLQSQKAWLDERAEGNDGGEGPTNLQHVVAAVSNTMKAQFRAAPPNRVCARWVREAAAESCAGLPAAKARVLSWERSGQSQAAFNVAASRRKRAGARVDPGPNGL